MSRCESPARSRSSRRASGAGRLRRSRARVNTPLRVSSIAWHVTLLWAGCTTIAFTVVSEWGKKQWLYFLPYNPLRTRHAPVTLQSMTAPSPPQPPSGPTLPYLAWSGPPGAPRREASVVASLDSIWEVKYDLVVDPPGRLVLIGVRVSLPPGIKPPAGGLTAATLRRLRVGDYVRHLEPVLDRIRRDRGMAKAAAGLRQQGFGFLLDGISAPRPSIGQRTARRGRPTLSDRLLAHTAAAYIAALGRNS